MDCRNDCRYFDGCSAPLCPLDESSVSHAAWFPDEEICRLADSPEWVSRQKKISKKLTFESGCFTVRMLERKCRFTSGQLGVDPAKGNPHNLEDAWLKEHPTYVPSEKQAEHSKKIASGCGFDAK